MNKSEDPYMYTVLDKLVVKENIASKINELNIFNESLFLYVYNKGDKYKRKATDIIPTLSKDLYIESNGDLFEFEFTFTTDELIEFLPKNIIINNITYTLLINHYGANYINDDFRQIRKDYLRLKTLLVINGIAKSEKYSWVGGPEGMSITYELPDILGNLILELIKVVPITTFTKPSFVTMIK